MHCSKVVLKKSSVNRVWCDVMSFNLRQDTTRGSIFLHRLGFQISRFFKADLLSSGSHIDVFDILTETNLHLQIGELEDLAQLIMDNEATQYETMQYSTRRCDFLLNENKCYNGVGLLMFGAGLKPTTSRAASGRHGHLCRALRSTPCRHYRAILITLLQHFYKTHVNLVQTSTLIIFITYIHIS